MYLYIYNPEMVSKSEREKNGFWVSAVSLKNRTDPPVGQRKYSQILALLYSKRSALQHIFV